MVLLQVQAQQALLGVFQLIVLIDRVLVHGQSDDSQYMRHHKLQCYPQVVSHLLSEPKAVILEGTVGHIR